MFKKCFIKYLCKIMCSVTSCIYLFGCSHYYFKSPVIKINNEIKKLNNFNISSIELDRDYKKIPRGFYRYSTYKVESGDTLFYIAWITGKDFQVLAKKNNIKEIDKLKIGDILYIGYPNMYLNYKLLSVCRQINNYVSLIMNIVYFPLSFFKKEIIKLKNDSFYIRYSKDIFFIYLIPIKKVSFFIQDKDCIVPQNVSKKAGVIDKVFYCSDNPPITNIHKWCWPAHGKIIDYFSSNEIGNKGIDISGFLGQPVLATTAGKVIYAGSALRGYGNLVIIQHNNDWLSAYAHNDTILVNDQEKVQVGQKIATMGSTETDLVKLHFEIRYKGKSVNPLCYLP